MRIVGKRLVIEGLPIVSDEKLIADTTLKAIDQDGREFEIYLMFG